MGKQMHKDTEALPAPGSVNKGWTMVSNEEAGPRHSRRILLALLLPLTCTSPALAQQQQEEEETGLRIQAGTSVQAVDNLFATSSDQVSDVIATGTLGLSLKAAHSRQQLALDAMLNANRYLAHSDWDHLGSRLSGGWQWSSGAGFNGSVTLSRVEAQNVAGNSVDNTQRNLVTTKTSQVALGYELDGGWELNSGLVYSSSKNERAVVGQTSFEYSGAYVGTTYRFRSGNILALTVQKANGANLYDYSIRSSELRFSTQRDEAETYTWNLIHWNQSYEQNPVYDFSVLGGGMQVNWPITGKTTLGMSAQRQFYGNPSANSIYTTINSLALTPAWEVSPKATLRGTLQYGVSRDRGDPGAGPSGRVDHIRLQSLGWYWALQENISVSTVVGRTQRTSTVNNAGFVANQVTLQALYTF